MPSRFHRSLAFSHEDMREDSSLLAPQEWLSRDFIRHTGPLKETPSPLYSHLLYTHEPFWRAIRRWRHVSTEEFLFYRWQVGQSPSSPTLSAADKQQTKNTIDRTSALLQYLEETVPRAVAPHSSKREIHSISKSSFIADVEAGIKAAPMSIRLTPYVLSLVNWQDPYNDPISRQFLPVKSLMVHDHSLDQLDSLHEEEDSPVPGLVHRYPDKVLFLGKYQNVPFSWTSIDQL